MGIDAHENVWETDQNRLFFCHMGKECECFTMPYLHEQVMNKKETASLSKDDVVKAIEASIEAIVDSKQ